MNLTDIYFKTYESQDEHEKLASDFFYIGVNMYGCMDDTPDNVKTAGMKANFPDGYEKIASRIALNNPRLTKLGVEMLSMHELGYNCVVGEMVSGIDKIANQLMDEYPDMSERLSYAIPWSLVERAKTAAKKKKSPVVEAVSKTKPIAKSKSGRTPRLRVNIKAASHDKMSGETSKIKTPKPVKAPRDIKSHKTPFDTLREQEKKDKTSKDRGAIREAIDYWKNQAESGFSNTGKDATRALSIAKEKVYTEPMKFWGKSKLKDIPGYFGPAMQQAELNYRRQRPVDTIRRYLMGS